MTGLRYRIRLAAIATSIAALIAFPAVVTKAQEVAQPPEPGIPAPPADAADESDNGESSDKDDIDVLTHGPVHEAFANPVPGDADEGPVVPAAPPEAIDELPPEYMPEGDNVEWIPGYWAWDDEAEDYLWVSGLWRNVPPDQRWVPGYWTEADGGYRWVSGFWTGQETAELDYLPYPPESMDQGPNVAAPSSEHFWVPGCWVHQSTDYQWQPGYWAPGYDNWCWIPRRYTWTPRGALYSPGYWDYRLPYRGVLFAPVRFANRAYYRGARRYTPWYAINPSGLLVNLFVRPLYRHYYFGNYYDNRYRARGYRPWYNAGRGSRYYYDPMLSFYQSYYNRRGVDFSGRMNRWYDYYDRNPNRRPPRTWNDTVRVANRGGANASPIVLARSLRDLANDRGDGPRGNRPGDDGNFRFRRLSEDQQVSFRRSADDIRDIVKARDRIENRRELADTKLPDRERIRDRVNEARPGPQIGRDDDGRDRRIPEIGPGRDRERVDRERPDRERVLGDVGDRRPDRAVRDLANDVGNPHEGLRLPKVESRSREILGDRRPGGDNDRVRGPRDNAPPRIGAGDQSRRPGGDQLREARERFQSGADRNLKPNRPQSPADRPGGGPGAELRERIRNQPNLPRPDRGNSARERGPERPTISPRSDTPRGATERKVIPPSRENSPKVDRSPPQRRQIEPRKAPPKSSGTSSRQPSRRSGGPATSRSQPSFSGKPPAFRSSGGSRQPPRANSGGNSRSRGNRSAGGGNKGGGPKGKKK